MMKVLFLSFDKNLGLTYHFVDWIIALDKVVKNELKVIFLTLKKEQNIGLHQKLKNLRFSNIIAVNTLDNLEKLELLREVDIIHCQGFRQVARVLKIKKQNKLRFKIIITMHAFRHGSWYRPFYTNLVSLLYLNKIDVVHFLSHTSKEEFLKYNLFYRHSNLSFTFPLGCNNEEFLRDEPIQDLEFYKELIENGKNIIYLAEFSKRKQHIWLINAIKDTLIQENAKLWLFGGGTEKEKVIDYVKKKSLSQHVRLPGRVDRKFIPTILKKMDLAVCTSKSENSPHAIMEPMFAGIPVVTFNVGTANYLIRDFTTGFIVNNRYEKRNFIRKIELLLQNRSIANRIGSNAKSYAQCWLTWDIVANNTLDMYRFINRL